MGCPGIGNSSIEEATKAQKAYGLLSRSHAGKCRASLGLIHLSPSFKATANLLCTFRPVPSVSES